MESNRCSTDIFTRLHIAYISFYKAPYSLSTFTKLHTAYFILTWHFYTKNKIQYPSEKRMDFGTKHNVHCHIKNAIISIWILTDFLIMDTHTHLQDTHALQWVTILHVWNKPSIFLLKNIFDILNVFFFIRGDSRKQIFTNKFMDSRSYWRFFIENKIHRNGQNIVDKTTSITNKNEFLTKSIRLFWLTFLHCSLQHTNQQHTLATRYWNIRMFVTTNDPT